MLTSILTFLGIAQSTPAVQEVEKAALAKSIGLIHHLFGWVETKEAGHPLLLAATDKLEQLIEQHGEEDLIAFLASKGIMVVAVPPPVAPAETPAAPLP